MVEQEKIKQINPSRLISGWELIFIRFLLRFRIFQIGIRKYRNPVKALMGLKRMVDFRRSLHVNKLTRFVNSNNRYFFALNVPGWPSKSFDTFIDSMFDRNEPEIPKRHLLSLMFAITKKCPLKCEHCFEWDRLNGNEKLSVDDIKVIIKKFQERGGLGQIQFSGGEPLQRFDDLIIAAKTAKKSTDFWVITSGYRLNEDKAKQLKEAGFSGVNISLDHWDGDMHDTFRGMPGSYTWVEKACENTKKEGLVLALTLCATKAFTSKKNLWKYADYAKKLGASFVQILEPKAVGHYAGKNVDISNEQQLIIENFFLKINGKKKFQGYPIFQYPAHHQRKIGCFGSGDMYMYVDSNGNAHACPFCQTVSGNCVSDLVDNTIKKMQEKGCPRNQNNSTNADEMNNFQSYNTYTP
tara:strand:+ start:1372 stop:2601 length:1230 start_codon:yes stop_codon:yes gene_type:complete